MPSLFVIKLCFTNIVKTICGGGQLLISGFQGPSSRFPGVKVPCPRISGSRVPKFLIPGPRVQVSGSQAWFPGSQPFRSQILILEYTYDVCMWDLKLETPVKRWAAYHGWTNISRSAWTSALLAFPCAMKLDFWKVSLSENTFSCMNPSVLILKPLYFYHCLISNISFP